MHQKARFFLHDGAVVEESDASSVRFSENLIWILFLVTITGLRLVQTHQFGFKRSPSGLNRISPMRFFLEQRLVGNRSHAPLTSPLDWERFYRRRAYAARRAVTAVDRAIRLTSTGPINERDQALRWMRLWTAFAVSRHR